MKLEWEKFLLTTRKSQTNNLQREIVKIFYFAFTNFAFIELGRELCSTGEK